MPFLWNDDNVVNRSFNALKYDLKFAMPTILISIIGWYLFLGEDANFLHILLVSGLIGTIPRNIFGFLYLHPHGNIPEDYHPAAQRIIYLFFVILSSLIIILLVNKFDMI